MTHGIKSGTLDTAALGWRMPQGTRSCPAPAPRRVAIEGIPYRDGDIDLTKALGKAAYGCRTLTYSFKRSGFATEAAADKAAGELASALAGIVNAEVYDSLVACTYVGATCSADVEIDSSIHGSRTVTVQLTAQPYTKGGSL